MWKDGGKTDAARHLGFGRRFLKAASENEVHLKREVTAYHERQVVRTLPIRLKG